MKISGTFEIDIETYKKDFLTLDILKQEIEAALLGTQNEDSCLVERSLTLKLSFDNDQPEE